jgi:hypothetical protein
VNAPPVLTAYAGTNADLLPHILEMYVKHGSVVADVTYGKGAFWRNVDVDKYDLRPTDLITGTDFHHLPYTDGSIDCLVIDPPYLHGGASIKASINDCYRNNNTGHESVIRLYAGALLEAARVLKKRGVVIVKCQDEIESGRQRFSHIELVQLIGMLGFAVIDLFVLLQTGIPAMREKYQKSARKNHSYALVARFRR